MDLQDGVADVSVCTSVVEEVANDPLLQVQEIAIGGLEVTYSQWSDRWQTLVSFLAAGTRSRILLVQLTPWFPRTFVAMKWRFCRKPLASGCLRRMVRTTSQSVEALEHC